MKAFLISMFLVLSAVLCAADDYFDWYRVMTDSATPATYCGAVNFLMDMLLELNLFYF